MVGSRLGHFRIVARVGAGGMGEVYRARDEHLDRDVALKVLPAGLLADGEARRHFRREALALSRLNHPNIATIHDFDTYDGRDVLVMEFVAGESLSDRIARGAMREEEAVRLATQLADGLAAAHAEGIVHRDLKPANLRVLPDGRLKILDFGLAVLHRPAGDVGATRTVTVDGVVSGTLPYMAPEQVRGDPADARTDLYAVGVTLYEMVTGQRPFPDTNTLRLAEAITHEPCPPPGRIAHGLSSPLEQIILKCAEKDPTLRYQSTTELLVDLRRLSAGSTSSSRPGAVAPRAASRRRRNRRAIAVGVGAIAVVIAAAAWMLSGRLWAPGTTPLGGLPRVQSIAVLPLANLSGDPQQEYFADGMTEALTTDLAKIRALRVISRTSAMRYKGTTKGLAEIARELGVDAVVEGSVQHVGQRVRITTQLIHAASDQHLWAENYDRDVRDVLELYGEVARAVAREVRVVVTPEEQQRLQRRRQIDPAAQEAYLRGRYAYSKLTAADMQRAVDHFEQATAKDPSFGEAHAALAQAYVMRALAMSGGLDRAARRNLHESGRASASRAIASDPTIAMAHAVLAEIAMGDWNWPSAEQSLRRALELDGNSVFANFVSALFAIVHERRDDARRALERTVELDPANVATRTEAAEFSTWNRDYDRAIAYATQALAFDPAFRRAHFVLARAYESHDRILDAIAEYEKAGWSADRAQAARKAFERGGRRGFVRWTLAGLQDAGPDVNQMYVARDHARLGNVDEAFAALDRAYRDHERLLFLFKTIDWYEPLRGDPRFAELARRIGLPE